MEDEYCECGFFLVDECEDHCLIEDEEEINEED